MKTKIENLKIDFKRIDHRTDGFNFKDCKDIVHWSVTIENEEPFEYSVGIGHYVNTQNNDRYAVRQAINAVLGKKYNHRNLNGMFTDKVKLIKRSNALIIIIKPLPPSKEDVLYSLTMDSSAIYETFSDWCDNFGYSDDSIKAKHTYEACKDNAGLLIRLGFNLEELQEYFQDY